MKQHISLIVAIIAVVMVGVVVLCACAPASSPDKAYAALDGNGYNPVKTSGYVSGIVSAIAGTENVIEGTVSGSKIVEDKDGNKKTEYVMIVYYKTAKAAKEAWADAQKDADKDSNKKDDSDWVCARSGKMIYWGTKAGVKAAR